MKFQDVLLGKVKVGRTFPRVEGDGWRVTGDGWRVTGGGWRVAGGGLKNKIK